MSNTLTLPRFAAAARRRAFRAAVVRAFKAAWKALEEVGQRRAARALTQFDLSHGDRFPELRKELRAKEAESAAKSH